MNKKQIITICCGMAAALLLDIIEQEPGFGFHLALLSVVIVTAGLIYAFRSKKAKDIKDDQ